jgi:hypothetical protein
MSLETMVAVEVGVRFVLVGGLPVVAQETSRAETGKMFRRRSFTDPGASAALTILSVFLPCSAHIGAQLSGIWQRRICELLENKINIL